MDEKEMTTFIENMRTKLGEEASAIIADDLGTIITNNANFLREQANRDREIETLKKDKENLISANGNLLKQIPAVDTNFGNTSTEEEEVKEFSFKTMFDKKGNFIN